MTTLRAEVDRRGEFVRQPNHFTDRISADGSTGYPAERGRYHLYWSAACPWAHRAVLVIRLKGLEDVVTVSEVDPIRDERGWQFTGDYPDPVGGFGFLAEAYQASDPSFERRPTVPAIWDRVSGRIVTNDFPVIPEQLDREFNAWARHPEVDLYPEELRPELDELSDALYHDVNNGVYRAGFARSQEAYEDAVDALFARLDWLEGRLSGRRWLLGEQLTGADVHLYTTLARFDAVYHYHFKCNLRRLVDYPNLWAYARDLYQRPAFAETTDFHTIKQHYYRTHPHLNPSGVVPKGPAVDWEAPHERDRLPGEPGPQAA